MEGVAYHIRWIIEALEAIGFSIDEMQAIGGGSASPVWTGIIADITGRRLRVPELPLEAGAVGAALAVAVALGVHPNMDAVDDLIRVQRVVEPQEVNQTAYQGMYSAYRQFYSALAPIYRGMSLQGALEGPHGERAGR
jgi:xylulokinase